MGRLRASLLGQLLVLAHLPERTSRTKQVFEVLSGRSIRSTNVRPENTLSVLVIPNAGTSSAKLHDRVSDAARGFSFSWAVIELWWLHRIVRKEYLRVALSHDLNAAEPYAERCTAAIILTPSFDRTCTRGQGCGFLH
jgi:hypothetical protein